MSAYTRAYQGLVAGGMTPAAAAQALAELRGETGAELSAGLLTRATAAYATQPTDSAAIHRRKKAKFGAVIDAADWIALATSTGRLTTTPKQRDDRSTT